MRRSLILCDRYGTWGGLWFKDMEVAGVNQSGNKLADFSFFGALMSGYMSAKQTVVGLCRTYYGLCSKAFWAM